MRIVVTRISVFCTYSNWKTGTLRWKWIFICFQTFKIHFVVNGFKMLVWFFFVTSVEFFGVDLLNLIKLYILNILKCVRSLADWAVRCSAKLTVIIRVFYWFWKSRFDLYYIKHGKSIKLVSDAYTVVSTFELTYTSKNEKRVNQCLSACSRNPRNSIVFCSRSRFRLKRT